MSPNKLVPLIPLAIPSGVSAILSLILGMKLLSTHSYISILALGASLFQLFFWNVVEP